MDQNMPVPQQHPRVVRLRTVVLVSSLLLIVTALTVAGAMGAAFWIGGAKTPTVEQKRQTVVQEGEVIADIAQEVGKSVVSIITEQPASGQVFNSVRQAQGAGTGIIIGTNGLILTNKHVVPAGTNRVQVITHDGTTYDSVKIIGRDPLNDLAILQVTDPKNFVAAPLGDSDAVRTGQKVVAIGNALGQFQNTVTSGIISGMGRPVAAGDSAGMNVEQLSNLFQTDAAINSGNSGGPLLDFNGEVIGVNTAIAADAQNIGFAIPINEAKGIIQSAKTTGKLSRPYIGVRYISLTPAIAQQLGVEIESGAYIPNESGSIVRNSPADRAGLEPGDVITKVNGRLLDDRHSLTSVVGRRKVGDTVRLTIVRDGRERTIALTLAEAPSN